MMMMVMVMMMMMMKNRITRKCFIYFGAAAFRVESAFKRVFYFQLLKVYADKKSRISAKIKPLRPTD